MKTNTTLRNLFFAVAVGITISSCGSGDKKTDTIATDTVVAIKEVPEQQPTSNTQTFKDFDWSTVPTSNSEIGTFPYLTPPAGFFIQDKGGYDESKTGYSEMKDFNKLIMFAGQYFYNAEGKVAELKFSMKEKDADFNQYSFDNSVDKYLQSIGAKLIGNLKITNDIKDFLNKDNDMNIYHHIVGDAYNDPVRMYALNHAKGKIMFQVFSNSAGAEVGVVELAAFEQTIKAPTAVQR